MIVFACAQIKTIFPIQSCYKESEKVMSKILDSVPLKFIFLIVAKLCRLGPSQIYLIKSVTKIMV